MHIAHKALRQHEIWTGKLKREKTKSIEGIHATSSTLNADEARLFKQNLIAPLKHIHTLILIHTIAFSKIKQKHKKTYKTNNSNMTAFPSVIAFSNEFQKKSKLVENYLKLLNLKESKRFRSMCLFLYCTECIETDGVTITMVRHLCIHCIYFHILPCT